MLGLIKRVVRSIKFRKYNEFTRAEYFRSLGAKIGDNCRIVVTTMGSEPWLIEIGDRVAIAQGVLLLTHDGGTHIFRKEIPTLQHYGKIKIGNNCMVGANVILTAGVTIGDNCVIGAGSVVTRDIPSGSFAFGVPARVLMPIERYKEKFVEAWKIQKPLGYGDTLDPSRLDDVAYVSTQLAAEIWKIREQFE
jgi:acetyltransferase-like isoleucine patch superfamily enzyme